MKLNFFINLLFIIITHTTMTANKIPTIPPLNPKNTALDSIVDKVIDVEKAKYQERIL